MVEQTIDATPVPVPMLILTDAFGTLMLTQTGDSWTGSRTLATAAN